MAVYPMQALQDQMGQMSVHPTARAGDSPLLAMFSEGNIIVLQSQASRTNIRICDGEVQGSEDDGPASRFIVHVRRPGVVALQNEKAPNNWLGFYEGRTVGTGGGGPFCEVMVGELENNFVTLESVRYPGQKIGFFPDGRIKPATDVSNEDDGRFIPSVHFSPASSGQTLPQPMVSMPPAQGAPQASVPPGQYPPQASMPPGQYPPQASMPPGQFPPQASVAPGQYPPPQGPPQASMAPGQYPVAPGQYPVPPGQYPVAPGQYPPPQGGGYPQYPPGYGPPPPAQGSMTPPTQHHSPPPSTLPFGFSIMDAFQDGNVVCLVSRSSGSPCNILRGEVACSGRFGAPDSLWVVGVGANKAISLTNSKWPGCHISIRSSGKVLTGKGKKDKYAFLRVHVHPDNYVYFESVETPGSYVGFNSSGNPCRPKEVAASEDNAKFFVRAERQRHPPSCQINTAYGWPSVFATLMDRSVIQLYVKGAAPQYLCISKSGNVTTTNNGNDDHTFFIWIDRGMGIVSLQSRKSDGYRVRMTNFTVVAKGEPDFNADFRVKENSDRTISFESVTCPGGMLKMQSGKAVVDHFSVFLMTIQRFGRSETITKAPIN